MKLKQVKNGEIFKDNNNFLGVRIGEGLDDNYINQRVAAREGKYIKYNGLCSVFNLRIMQIEYLEANKKVEKLYKDDKQDLENCILFLGIRKKKRD